MHKILIVGAGEAGLQLALGLQQRGYDATVVSDRTPEDIAAGQVMSSQCMFRTALQTERRLGIDLWSGICSSNAAENSSFTMPQLTLTTTGPCEILETLLPGEAERASAIALTGDNGVLTGRFAPTVRKPVGVQPSGRPVLGVADVVVLNDPITGQGSNNAAKCAATYLDAKTGPYPLIPNGEKPDMTRTTSDTRDRTFVRGPEKVRATILTAGTKTGDRHDLAGSRGA